MALRSAQSELEAFADRSTVQFDAAFLALTSALARGVPTDAAFARVQKTIGQSMAMADLFGRRRLWLEFDAAEKDMGEEEVDKLSRTFYAATPLMPNVPFEEAWKDMLGREPRLAPNADFVSQLYQDRLSFALTKSAEVSLTDRIQGIITQAIKKGRPEPKAAQIIKDAGDFTTSYSRMVYRTNLNTAYTAGRFEQAQERGVRVVLPAMERFSVLDSALRQGRPQDGGENHKAAHGLLMETRDPDWAKYAPPSSYACRCGVRMVPRSELNRRGLLTPDGKVKRYNPPGLAAFRPHPNFGKRNPASLIYGT